LPTVKENVIAFSTLPVIGKIKYLVSGELTIGHFLYIIRKQLKLYSHQTIFLLIKNHIPLSATYMSSLYEHYKDIDGFLYITYYSENTFGGVQI